MSHLPFRVARRTCLVGLAVAALAATAADPAAPPEVFRLRYRFEPGATIATAVAHRALTETTMNGVTQ